MNLDKLLILKNYADMVGSRLNLFKVTSYSPYRSNFRCSICGDSSTNKYKRRGYILERDGGLQYYCHNECGSFPLEYYLKEHHPDLYSMYRFDLLRPEKVFRCEEVQIVEDEKPPVSEWPFSKLTSNDPLYDYVVKRKFDFFDDIWFSNNFNSDVNKILPDKLPEGPINKRLIFPMRDRDGEIYGLMARSMSPDDTPKYLTIKIDEDKPKFFGLNRLSPFDHAYVLEGPIDSLFVDNAVAMGGTDGNPLDLFMTKDSFTVVLDNQPRSKAVIRKYEKYINQGLNVMIWPKGVGGKDINEMVIDGYPVEKIKKLIDSNTFSGLKAKIRLKEWTRV